MSKDLMEMCYNIPGQSIYGEITKKSLEKIMKLVIPLLPPYFFKTPLNILDLGSGSGIALCTLGKLFMPYTCSLYGIEASEQRVKLAEQIMSKLVTPNVQEYKCENQDILQLSHLPPCHISYSFDKTFTKDLMEHIEKLQYKSYPLRFIITSKPKVYKERSDRWTEIAFISCTMKGSGSGVNFYIFEKIKTMS